MAKRLWGVSVAISVVVLAGQFALAENVTAQIPFQFKVGKQVLPAGTYVITFDKAIPKNLTIRARSGGAVASVPIITQLAMQDPTGAKAHIVFDKVEDEHTIAEFWPAKADGYYVGGVIVAHTHVVIDAK